MVQKTQPMTKPALNVPAMPVAKEQPVAQQPAQVLPVQKTSILKKWWFWLIFVVAIIGAGVGIYFLL